MRALGDEDDLGDRLGDEDFIDGVIDVGLLGESCVGNLEQKKKEERGQQESEQEKNNKTITRSRGDWSSCSQSAFLSRYTLLIYSGRSASSSNWRESGVLVHHHRSSFPSSLVFEDLTLNLVAIEHGRVVARNIRFVFAIERVKGIPGVLVFFTPAEFVDLHRVGDKSQ